MRRSTFKRTLFVMLGLVVLIVLMFSFALFGPSVPIVVSKKTTYLTEPLDQYGNVDYFEALRREQKEGVTVENNAAVLLWQAWGQMGLEPYEVEPLYAELGIPVPPEDGDYLVSVHDEQFQKQGAEWLRRAKQRRYSIPSMGQLIKKGAERLRGRPTTLSNPVPGPEDEIDYENAFFELVNDARDRPWRGEEFPPLAYWLKKNQKPIDLIFEATKRPRMYAPMVRPVPNENTPGVLLGLLHTTSFNCRSAASALRLRSMAHLGAGRIDEAWADAFACHRLARLVGEGPSVTAQMLACSFVEYATRLDAAILDRQLTKKQVDRMRTGLASLGPCSDVAQSMGRAERCQNLDLLIMVSGQETTEGMGSKELDAASHTSINWNVPLEMANKHFDGFVTAMMIPRFADRKVAIEQEVSEFEDSILLNNTPKSVLQSLLSRQSRSEIVGKILAAKLCLPTVNAVSSVEDRGNIRLALTRVAVELAAYRTEHGEYPQKLEDLGKGVFDKLPVDFFVEEPFRYERRGEGYLLYSVGRNMQDNGGTSTWDETIDGEHVGEEEASNLDYETHDDFVIRLPLPPLEIPKRRSKADEDS